MAGDWRVRIDAKLKPTRAELKVKAFQTEVKLEKDGRSIDEQVHAESGEEADGDSANAVEVQPDASWPNHVIEFMNGVKKEVTDEVDFYSNRRSGNQSDSRFKGRFPRHHIGIIARHRLS